MRFIFLMCTLILSLYSLGANAHGRWIVPSHTILSGENPEYVSLDFSISNDIFHPDIPYGGKPLAMLFNSQEAAGKKKEDKNVGDKKSTEKKSSGKKSEGNSEREIASLARRQIMIEQFSTTRLQIVDPDGHVSESDNIVNLGRKSASAVQLVKSGTYQFKVIQKPVLITLFKDKDGHPAREFGPLTRVKSYLPKGYTDPMTLRIFNNVMTYVTRNELSKKLSTADKSQLDITFKTHPNELFVNEALDAVLTIKGKPAKNTELRLVRGGTRHRNERNPIVITTDEEGKFSVEWEKAGLYFLETEWTEASATEGIDKDMYALYITLEVNAE